MVAPKCKHKLGFDLQNLFVTERHSKPLESPDHLHNLVNKAVSGKAPKGLLRKIIGFLVNCRSLFSCNSTFRQQHSMITLDVHVSLFACLYSVFACLESVDFEQKL